MSLKGMDPEYLEGGDDRSVTIEGCTSGAKVTDREEERKMHRGNEMEAISWNKMQC